MIIQEIDKGKPFDWGKTSDDYAKYRDIYLMIMQNTETYIHRSFITIF